MLHATIVVITSHNVAGDGAPPLNAVSIFIVANQIRPCLCHLASTCESE